MTVWAKILSAVEAQGACALVTVVAAEGSVPRDAGARMIVTREGYSGSIGGGALEWRAIATAQAMLGSEGVRRESHALGPELGQCCGGRVKLSIEAFNRGSLAKLSGLAAAEPEAARRCVYLFGAGHVGKALVLALAPLPFDLRWIDGRENAFPPAMPQNVTAIAPADPLAMFETIPDGSIALVMTHSHALDLAIVDAALRNRRVAHVGLIGSATKRARFEKRLREAGVAEARIESLICPIGVPGIKSKEPAAIAASVAAQLLMLHEAMAVERTAPKVAHG
jgi:xanthine dehydrogenase accessory factor